MERASHRVFDALFGQRMMIWISDGKERGHGHRWLEDFGTCEEMAEQQEKEGA